MPWEEYSKMNQRKEFVLKAITTDNFRALCREYKISPKTGYKWKERFLQHGLEGLNEKSRRPRSSPDQLPETVVCELIRLKHQHPGWGPEKILAVYLRGEPERKISLSSVNRVLDRAGLVAKRRKRKSKQSGRIHSDRKAEKPNDVWTVDFKGWWRDQEGKKCEPLTIRDEYSRYLICVDRTQNGTTGVVRESFERVFERHGLPKAIRSDNGSPFASTGLLGLSKLSVWWLALGIDLERGRPGCPQDNGGHERMHLDIEQELAGFESSQAAFDVWRQTFNEERPHQALNNRVPAEVYQNSDIRFKGTPKDISYEGMQCRKVSPKGIISYNKMPMFISHTLAGWSVGLKAQSETTEEVYFANLYLGHLETKNGHFVKTEVN